MKQKKNTTTGLCGILITTCFAIFMFSCSSTTTPSNNNNTGSTAFHPKVGSTFTDSAYTRDTNLNPVQGSGQIIVYTLTDTTATIAGKTNVFVFSSPGDTVYLHYESNGDISNYATFSAGSFFVGQEWVTLPVESQSTIALAPFKAFVLIDTIQISGTAKGAGTGTDIVGTHSLPTGKTTLNVDAYSATYNSHTTAVVNNSYASSIGFITRYDITTLGNFIGIDLRGGTHRFLIDYNLK